MKSADREHKCEALKRPQPNYKVMRDISTLEWSIWIPDFLRDTKEVKAFVWRVRHCPFCGESLLDESHSRPI